MIGILPRRSIQQAVDFIIALGFAMANFGCIAQNFAVYQLAQQTGFLNGRNFNMPDFAGDIAFFVGQEIPEVAIATDQTLMLQTGQAFLNLALECQLVGINLIHAEGSQVIDVGFDDVRDTANQEQSLEQMNIVKFQQRIVWRFLNRLFCKGIDEALDGWIKVVNRYERINTPFSIQLGCRLESIQQ